MAFMLDAEELKPGLVIFRRADVKHRKFYCRVKVPKADRYKIVSLKTSDRDAARDEAFEYDTEVRWQLKHDVPVFNRPFAQIASDYLVAQKERAETGGITKKRLESIESAINTLNLKLGSKQIHVVTQADWDEYPVWRRRLKKREGGKKDDKDKKSLKRKQLKPPASGETPRAAEADAKAKAKAEKWENWRVSDWTIRAEMTVFRSIMAFAARRKYIPETQIPKGKLQSASERREEFTREEYRALHTKAREWKKKAKTKAARWYREMVYNFILVMCNTGMRPPEAKNLRWRDVSITTIRKETKGKENKNAEASVGEDYAALRAAEIARQQDEAKQRKRGRKDETKKPEEERKLVILNVQGKGKYRRLVAPDQVATYLERIRAIAKATGPNDCVFTTHNGKKNDALYAQLVKKLLSDKDVNLLIGPQGSERSTYSFRHTYATLRLSEGVDVYLLAEQMGTSVQIIQDHYGHINPVKNADRILMGMPVWEDAELGADGKASAAEAGAKPQPSKSAKTRRSAAAKAKEPA
jgi:integrase